MRYMDSCQSRPKRTDIKTTFICSLDRSNVHKSSFSILFSTANATNRKAEHAITIMSGADLKVTALLPLFMKSPIRGAETNIEPNKHIIKKAVILHRHFVLL